MASTDTTSLIVHTLDTLCNELVSGRMVEVDDNGSEFGLPSKDSRAIFDWYRKNRTKWAGNVQKADVEAIVDQLATEPPSFPITAGTAPSARRCLRLQSVTTHRFGGIQPFGQPGQPPSDFRLTFANQVTLIEGINGSGKTSILNAICWCLTGAVSRPQRPPEPIADAVAVELADATPTDGATQVAYDMAAITPMPSADVLRTLGNQNVPLDTWVELVFADSAGNLLAPIRRSLRRTARGKLEVVQPDLSVLGLTPIGLEIGTKMTGLIPYIRLGTACDLGKAVASLTGLRPLEDLVRHAEKVRSKLTRDFVREREAEIAQYDADYTRVLGELSALPAKHTGVSLPGPILAPSDSAAEDCLARCAHHLESLQAQALGESQAILGDALDPHDAASRKDLLENVGPAIGNLDPVRLKALVSAQRLSGLGNLMPEEVSQAELLLQKIRAEAVQLAEMSTNPEKAARLRLYARVAGWLRDTPGATAKIEDCPVCKTSLESKRDPVTGQLVTDHLAEYVREDTQFLEDTLAHWEEHALAHVRASLPASLQAETRQQLPTSPCDLIRAALAQELFQARCFGGCLAPLREAANSLCDAAFAKLPIYVDPPSVDLPVCFGNQQDSLAECLRRIDRALAFARWRTLNRDACRRAFLETVGEPTSASSGPTVSPPAAPITEWTLLQRLLALDRIVRSAEPLSEGLDKVASLSAILKRRREKQARIALYGKAATAIEPLLNLHSLVERQVSALLTIVSARTADWKQQLYSPAFVGAPRINRADVASDGAIEIEAAAGGTRTRADHISNASDLRATLFAFLFAFWEHLLTTRGGLSLLLLDDTQELFDRENRRRLANTLPALAGVGGQPVIATSDHRFGNMATMAFRKAAQIDKVDHLQIHPLNPNRDCLGLTHFLEEIDRKREAFEQNVNDNQSARDYVKDLRIYIEGRLLDLCDVPHPALPKEATLADLLGAVRSRVSAGHEVFCGRVIRDLVSDQALRNGSPFLELMNRSHHSGESAITYGDVHDIAQDCLRVRRAVDAAHEEYELWLRRDPRDCVPELPVAPPALAFPSFSVPLIGNLAAFTSDMSPGEPVAEADCLTDRLLSNHASFVLNTHNFGFSAETNARVLVSLVDEEVRDNSLVVAIYGQRIFARRLVRDSSNPGIIALVSNAENPSKRPPSLLAPASEVRLLRVVGVLFSDVPAYPQQSGEAWPVDARSLLGSVAISFKVVGDSAIPLALPGQIVLGGKALLPADLAGKEGCPVAIATSEGAALKRIGPIIPGVPQVRRFESIGGLGESMLVQVEECEALPDIPALQAAREVLGVLYISP